MSCYRPIYMELTGLKENGKQNLRILHKSPDDPDFDQYRKDRSIIYAVPCGRCLGCRLDHAKMWADRCMLELQDHQESYFLTLTYDDQHITINDNLAGILVKADLQKFFKRLRKDGQNIRYFACGEYGDQTLRPHYHAIVFGLHLPDRKFFRRSSKGNYSYWTSEYLLRMWHHGQILITDVTYETCSYVARYVVKKINADTKQLYSDLDITPEFIVMSRKPGIARKYYDLNKEKIFESDYITVATSRRGLKFKPPRYYNKLLELDDPDKFYDLRASRQAAAEIISSAQTHCMQYSPSEERQIKERNKERQMKLCSRKMI